MKFLKKILPYFLVAVIASGVTAVLLMGRQPQRYSKLDEMKSLIGAYFIGDVDATTLENGAAAGMVAALDDRWSYYMTREEYLDYKEQMANAYVGIGIHIVQREDGYIDVVKVERGGPADEVGMQPGDVLIAVEGEDISPYTVDQIKERVRGEEGTYVEITVRREDQNLNLRVQRRTIKSIVASGKLLENHIGLVTIENFDSRCAEETIAAIEALLAQGAESLIFDVRYNPGGYKSELIKVLDYLLPEGPLFRSVDYTGKETVDTSDAKCLVIPMAVLINQDSYSAAEFFAAALSEYGVATLVGQSTTGKGRFQTSFALSDGSAMVMSIGKYCTPNGVSLTDVGLTPDILVEVDDETYMQIYYDTLEPKDDPQLAAAMDAMKK